MDHAEGSLWWLVEAFYLVITNGSHQKFRRSEGNKNNVITVISVTGSQ